VLGQSPTKGYEGCGFTFGAYVQHKSREMDQSYHLAEGAPNNTIVAWNTSATHEVKTAALPSFCER
jgi:hypothetical protein